jgi:hypothetical protein
MLKFMVRGCSGNTNTDGSMNVVGNADILRNVLITLGREQQVHQQRRSPPVRRGALVVSGERETRKRECRGG